MRDADRIDPTLDKIRQVWYSHPDMRLMQLLENCKQIEPGVLYYGHGCCMYYMEDDELVERLEEVYGRGDE